MLFALQKITPKRRETRGPTTHPLLEQLQKLDSPGKLSRADLMKIVGSMHLEHLRIRYAPEHQEETFRLTRQIATKLKAEIEARGYEPLSDGPLYFVASYPRSGNTLTLSCLEMVYPSQVLSSMIGTVNYIPIECYPNDYPLQRFVKTHEMPPYREDSKYVFVVRDGRDILPSIAYMTSQNGGHPYLKTGELANFIDWQCRDYRFGGWADFVRKMHALREKENVLIVRYDDLLAGPHFLQNIVDFFGLPHVPGAVMAAYEKRENILGVLKAHPESRKLWGLGAIAPEDTMFHAWSKNRKASNWRSTMDAAARKRFHETGATEFLIEYGFEDDENWWR